jgi:hypothetical protein
MADQWNDNNPALTNTIAADVADIEENTAWLRNILAMLAGWKTSTIATVGPGCITERAKFAYASVSTITINPGGYFHDGTTRQWCFWDAAITFIFGSAGSNADSSELGVSQWHYIYLDDTAIITQSSPELDADCFQNSTTAPSWSDSKHGWYNGSDRCIFAVLTNASSQIKEFYHESDLCFFADYVVSYTGTPSNSWADCTLSLPGFSREGAVTAYVQYVDTATGAVWRTNGQTGTSGHAAGVVTSGTQSQISINVLTDTSQVIEVKFSSASAGNVITISTDAWKFPIGM